MTSSDATLSGSSRPLNFSKIGLHLGSNGHLN